MEREQAVEVLERIIQSCKTVDGQFLALMPPNLSDSLSNGYQIHIKANLTGMERKCLEDILNEHRLVWHEMAEKTIIY